MKISVIIPTYKPQSYLWECLDSLDSQTYSKKEFEVILVLNGCYEPYNTEIKSYLSNHKDLQVNYIYISQGGVSNARNIALDNARGEYVTFIDDDDYVSPRYLELLYESASFDTLSLSYAYAFNDGNPSIQLSYPLTKVYDELCSSKTIKLSSKVRKYFSGPWMKLIPMNFIQERRFDVRFKNGEDSLFMFLISDKIHKISFASKDSVYYRRYREGSAVMRRRTIRERITNNWNCIKEYSRIYFKGKYSTYFYLSRIAAEIYCMCNAIIKK